MIIHSCCVYDQTSYFTRLEKSQRATFLLAVVQRIGEKKLLRKYKINGIVLEGLIDTGADVSVISSSCWDPTWPLESASAVWGVGGPQTSSKSVQWLPVSLPDSSETIAYIQPCVLKIHLNLWGRDLLQQLQATIQFNEEMETEGEFDHVKTAEKCIQRKDTDTGIAVFFMVFFSECSIAVAHGGCIVYTYKNISRSSSNIDSSSGIQFTVKPEGYNSLMPKTQKENCSQSADLPLRRAEAWIPSQFAAPMFP
ncbi:endogenous retrovirus group K member 10 Pro protein-like [Podarcis lilfordi]|uniref:Endogenous retrovirus group K member 10 Pro protein-like n=1 Tax=Podarcis lilfordi TaxID=74358 RepID=A0AA35LHJ0_9SAUR|nr:endogenous retrovirus group K member 10 Pro protein-like [Podarcis lilfordi]